MPLITSLTARDLSAKARLARAANRLKAKQAAIDLAAARIQAEHDTRNKAIGAAQSRTPDAYLAARLSCVRKQLDRLDDMLLKEIDPQKLDRLASAQMRLAEQERLLSDRPLPGSRRPVTPTASRSASHYPQPTPSPTPMPQPQPTDNSLSSSPASDLPPTDPS